ncbi:MAG: glycosyltransferase, partial [Bacteroidales bacterium]
NIIGDGSSAETLKTLIQKENIENVIMHGRYPYNQMHSVLSQSDALVISLVANSGIELTEPLKLQSYLTVGKPIYGVIEGAGKELIENNRLGICAAPDRVDEIAAKFREMVSFASSNRDKVKNSADQLLKTRFNKQLLVKKLTEYIDKTYK